MPFTAQELENISNALLDYHIRGPAYSQVIQDRPLFDWLMGAQKTFPGGKEYITEPVKGEYTTAVQGYTHDDEVSYANPANIKRTQASWYELHAGISLTLTELKKAGISIADSMKFGGTSQHSEAEKVQLTNLLDDKIEDMMEGYARSVTDMLWRDGTQDAKAIPGIRSFMLNSPSSAGLTFGIDRVANTWWRNRASLAIDTSTSSNLNLTNTLQAEIRQLRRYRGNPKKFLCGSTFLTEFEKELRSKGNFTLEGWAKKGSMDASIADISFKGVNLEYDPALDDLSLEKYGFWMDQRRIYLKTMEGEDRKIHNPARPPERYVLYRSITYTGALCCSQMNSNGVYSVA